MDKTLKKLLTDRATDLLKRSGAPARVIKALMSGNLTEAQIMEAISDLRLSGRFNEAEFDGFMKFLGEVQPLAEALKSLAGAVLNGNG